MSYIDPRHLFRCLVTEVQSGVDFSMSPLIAAIMAATSAFGLAGIPHDVLVRVGLGFEFMNQEAEVLVTCRSPEVFENVRAAYNDERLRFELRSIKTADMPSSATGDAQSGADELAIDGIIERYCVLRIHLHPRLGCVTFQFC